jgi:5-methylcytosine-specific restriction endonuclease McrA
VKPKKARKPKSFYLRSWLIGQLRRIYRRYPPYFETLNKDQIVSYVKSKKGKDLKRVHVTCAHCHQIFKKAEVQVDHIIPVVPESGFPTINGEDDWNTYLKRFLVGPEGLQRLCKPCHQIKTNSENENRPNKKKKKIKKKA